MTLSALATFTKLTCSGFSAVNAGQISSLLSAIVLSEGVENAAIRAGAAMKATIIMGIRRVVIIKLFFATLSVNSRAMIMLIFELMIVAGCSFLLFG